MTEQTEQSWLTPEWHARGLRALLDTVDVELGLKREMVEFLLSSGLWDSGRLTYDGAISRFNNCLLPNKLDFFKTSHLVALMKQFDRIELLRWMADELNCDIRLRPTAERTLRMTQRAAEAFERAQTELAMVRSLLAQNGASSLKVHPAFRDGIGAFQLADQPQTPLAAEERDPGF